MKHLKQSLAMWLLLTIATGIIYPLAMTGIGQLIFHHEANGSVMELSGKLAGSELLGQEYSKPSYFWSRRSTTGGMLYNGAASTGSNQGPLNPSLFDAVKGRVETLKVADSKQEGLVPIDLATASSSGLDPDISPAAAYYQIQRVAEARSVSQAELKTLVETAIEGRQFGLLGERRINVLKLNMMLDSHYPTGDRETPHD